MEYDRFVSDFRGIMGALPPFKKLGFQDLEHLLRSIPDTVIIERGYDGCILKVNALIFFTHMQDGRTSATHRRRFR